MRIVIKKVGVILLLAAMSLILGSSSVVYSATSGWRGDNDHSKDDPGSSVRNSLIEFNNDKVSPGEPLIVDGAPEKAVYQWTIQSADGSAKTFTTTENTYTPVDTDIEKLITVKVVGLEGAEATIYYSALPVIYINNANGYYGVGEEFTDAVMSVQGNSAFYKEKELYSDEIQIKLRGNSTKWREKAPFNIKLDKATDLLGMGKNKHWALLANDIDHTLMRNKLMYDFSGTIGMEPYMKSENIVLIYNNQYYGVYELAELVNLDSDRVDIYDWEDSAKEAAKSIIKDLVEKGKLTQEKEEQAEEKLEDELSTDLGWITSPYTCSYDVDEDGVQESYIVSDYIDIPKAIGGVLLEMDFYAFDGHHPSTLITSYSQPWYFKSPEYAMTNDSLYEYTKQYIQAFEYALHSTDYTYHEDSNKYMASNRSGGNRQSTYRDSSFSAPEYEGKHYSQLFDFDSLVQNFIVCEFAMNWDSMKNSVFMYKDIDGLFHLGPEWDFDWAMGNINMFGINTWYPTSWHTTEKNFTVEQYYQTVQWNRSLIRDPYFLVRVYEKYKEVRSTAIEDIIKDGGIIDTYTDELRTAAAANDAKWDYTYAQYHSVGFEQSVTNMKKFINTRITWMDEQCSSLDSFIASLGYYKPSTELSVSNIEMKSDEGYALVTAKVTSTEIASVAFQINGTHLYDETVTDGIAECKVPIQDLTEDKDTLNVIQILAKDRKGEYIIDSMEVGNYYNAKSNYAVFHSGDNMDGKSNNKGDLQHQGSDSAEATTNLEHNNEGFLPIAIVGLSLIGIVALVGLISYLKIKNRKKTKNKE